MHIAAAGRQNSITNYDLPSKYTENTDAEVKTFQLVPAHHPLDQTPHIHFRLCPRVHCSSDVISFPHIHLPSTRVFEGRNRKSIRLCMALRVVLILLNPNTDVEAPVTGLAMRCDSAVLRACADFAGVERRVAIFAGAFVSGDCW